VAKSEWTNCEEATTNDRAPSGGAAAQPAAEPAAEQMRDWPAGWLLAPANWLAAE